MSEEDLTKFLQKFYAHGSDQDTAPKQLSVPDLRVANASDTISVKTVGSGPKCFPPLTLCKRASGELADKCPEDGFGSFGNMGRLYKTQIWRPNVVFVQGETCGAGSWVPGCPCNVFATPTACMAASKLWASSADCLHAVVSG